VKQLIGRPQEALLCAKAKRQRQMFSVAKAKRQLQSTQSEWRSTPRFEKGLYFLICHLDFIDNSISTTCKKSTFLKWIFYFHSANVFCLESKAAATIMPR